MLLLETLQITRKPLVKMICSYLLGGDISSSIKASTLHTELDVFTQEDVLVVDFLAADKTFFDVRLGGQRKIMFQKPRFEDSTG